MGRKRAQRTAVVRGVNLGLLFLTLTMSLIGACTSPSDSRPVGAGGATGGSGPGSGGIAGGYAPGTGGGGGAGGDSSAIGGVGGDGGDGSGGGGVAGSAAGSAGGSAGGTIGGGGRGLGGDGAAGSAGGSAGGTMGSGGRGSGGGGAAGSAGGSAAGTMGSGGRGAGGGGGASAALGCDWASPEGRIVLFDGTTLDNWQSGNGGQAPWVLYPDSGTLQVVPGSGNIQTKMKFEDLCLHLEYQTPMYPANVTGQNRGNSGIYFKRAYEMQVLDSYGQPPLIDGCGAVYNVSPPLVVACKMEREWNTYEIEFKASKWNGNSKIQNAVFVEARLNGMVVQRNVELPIANTTAGTPDVAGAQPLMLQDHNNEVRFRNIWAKIPRY